MRAVEREELQNLRLTSYWLIQSNELCTIAIWCGCGAECHHHTHQCQPYLFHKTKLSIVLKINTLALAVAEVPATA
ncbi:hypothetical protein D3C84_1091320 [compost metagenome]